jgi:hypothetical protein
MKKFKPHYSIHLGDVYYVGDDAEVGQNFLGIKNPDNDFEPCLWPPGSRGSFALNGNHEMYALGYAYFENMLPTLGVNVAGKAIGQNATYFCLENDHWRIIAVDTGYNSIGWPVLEYIFPPNCALRPELIDWLRNVVRPRKDDPRGIIILGHHQVYSCYDNWYPKQARQLAEFFCWPRAVVLGPRASPSNLPGAHRVRRRTRVRPLHRSWRHAGRSAAGAAKTRRVRYRVHRRSALPQRRESADRIQRLC